MLQMIASFSGLKALDVGYSSCCTHMGVMNLTRLTSLQCLSVSGICSHDFGLLDAHDIAILAAMPQLAVLEACNAPFSFSMQCFFFFF